MKNIKHLLFVVVIVLLVISINLFFYQTSSAGKFEEPAKKLTPFGGPILPPITFCANGLLLVIGPPVGGLFLFPWTAKLYAFYNPTPKAMVLGLYTPVGECVAPDFCYLCPPIPAQGTIFMMGTSY